MPTYITGESVPNGTITHTIIEQEWLNGKPFLKKSYTVIKGDIKKRNANKKAKAVKKTEKAKAEVQQQLSTFQNVEIEEDGF